MILNAILLVYSLLLIVLIITIFLHSNDFSKPKIRLNNLPSISVVIPIRNEEKNLKLLIQSLNMQKYNGFVEIIFVNDSSTDNSVKVIKEEIPFSTYPIHVIDSIYDKNIALSSKQQAIEKGITYSKNDYIVLTDADMQYSNEWLTSLGYQAYLGADLAFGHTSTILLPRSIFSFFQAFQLEFLFSVAYVFHHLGITGSCMGNNLIVSKKAYKESGGQKKIGYSIVEDRALYALFKKNRKKCTLAEPFKAEAFTYACSSFPQFYNQMRRWAKGGLNSKSSLVLIGGLFTFQNIMIILSFFHLFSNSTSIIVTINFLFTWIFTSICFRLFKSNLSSIAFPVFQIALIIESLFFFCSFLLFPRIDWKGRKL